MNEPYEGFGWIKVKRFKEDESKSWEDRYKALLKHHEAEATFLINKVRELGKSEAIVQKMVELANDDRPVTFEQDFGGNTVTLYVGQNHTHCGVPDGAFELLVQNLYNSLHGGPGLSWANTGRPEIPATGVQDEHGLHHGKDPGGSGIALPSV